jgi:UDP-N-acetylglucosamine 2-epimerase (non-hydrolysing)/GDP/UDP-N,N'-diacetylbacillosamine 2-epimerase (hydrolysing)
MSPIYRAVSAADDLSLHLVVTGMHLLPEFRSGLDIVRNDRFGILHYVSALLGEDSSQAMAQSFGHAVAGIAPVLARTRPDIVLLQGDRGEMLAAAIAAAHMNLPIVHMSGGDRTGSIDDSIRHALSKFAHVHLATCAQSGEMLHALGEEPARIRIVGEPGLDAIRELDAVHPEELARELQLDLSRPILLATLHPVTTEAHLAQAQMTALLDALEALNMQTVFTYPNSDAGGRDMALVLESRRDRSFLRIVPNLGSRRYLSLLGIAAVLVGNSSSGIFEAPSFKLPAVNIGTRQHGRLRADNVLDVGNDKDQIVAAIKTALSDSTFRSRVQRCINPYGDGFTAPRTVEILRRLRLVPSLLTKWIPWDPSLPLTD